MPIAAAKFSFSAVFITLNRCAGRRETAANFTVCFDAVCASAYAVRFDAVCASVRCALRRMRCASMRCALRCGVRFGVCGALRRMRCASPYAVRFGAGVPIKRIL